MRGGGEKGTSYRIKQRDLFYKIQKKSFSYGGGTPPRVEGDREPTSSEKLEGDNTLRRKEEVIVLNRLLSQGGTTSPDQTCEKEIPPSGDDA